MKKGIKILVTILIIAIIGFGIYKIFIDCEKVTTFYDRDFVLETMDYATIENEAIVKLIGIDDNRCKEESCEREGEMVAKVFVINDHHMTYVKLGTLAETRKELEKLGIIIELVEIDKDNKVTLKVTKLD